jgi:hypothetical protein
MSTVAEAKEQMLLVRRLMIGRTSHQSKQQGCQNTGMHCTMEKFNHGQNVQTP